MLIPKAFPVLNEVFYAGIYGGNDDDAGNDPADQIHSGKRHPGAQTDHSRGGLDFTAPTSGDHIALGGDLDGCDTLPKGFDGVQSYPAMAAKLLERGLDAETVHKIFWDNALGVMEKCCM